MQGVSRQPLTNVPDVAWGWDNHDTRIYRKTDTRARHLLFSLYTCLLEKGTRVHRPLYEVLALLAWKFPAFFSHRELLQIRYFGEHKSAGIDKLRAKRPDLHAWVTSTSWSKMDASSIKEHHGNIYTAKVNGIIPWAGIQRPAKWVGGDPNPGSAFTVHEDGSWEVRRGYFMYKQVTRAGQPGMAVVRTMAMDSEIAVIGFAANGTKNPDAFVLVNLGKTKQVNVSVKGSSATSFAAFRTTEDEQERYAAIGDFPLKDGAVLYEAPAGSVTTFFANQKPILQSTFPAGGKP